MKYDVESVQKRLDLLISLQEKTYDFLTQNNGCSIFNSSDVHHFEITFIDNDDDLEHFEDKLINKEFRTQMVTTWFYIFLYIYRKNSQKIRFYF